MDSDAASEVTASSAESEHGATVAVPLRHRDLRMRRPSSRFGESIDRTVMPQMNVSQSSTEREDDEKDDASNVATTTAATSARKHSPLRASTPAHTRPRESPLSSDAIFHQSHAGLFNLCIVLLVAVNSRLIIENLMKYGILIRSGFWFASHSLRDWPLLMCGLSLSLFPLLALLIEKGQANNIIPEKLVAPFHIVNICTEFIYPAIVINRVQSAPLGGFILIFIAVVTMMKLISYAHTHTDIRRLSKAGDRPEPSSCTPEVAYPDNLTLNNMAYFLAAPTLCYQLGYPRSHAIRRTWLLQQVVKLVAFAGLMLFIIEQYINPIIQHSQHPLQGHLLYSIERVLKLAIPTIYVWLCMFYCFFHLWLNILAELLRFGDREFYRDWWNAKTIEEYWKLWNMPVHRWLVRHVYFPCLNIGCSKPFAMFLVFFISAVFHEVLVGIPCHMVRMWSFLGIIMQVPLVILTKYLYQKFKSPTVGNMLFWFFFCIIGQPICVLLYYHDVRLNWQQQQQIQQEQLAQTTEALFRQIGTP